MKFYLFLLLTILVACSQESTSITTDERMLPQEEMPTKREEISADKNIETIKSKSGKSIQIPAPYSYDVVYTDSIGWGYEILQNDAVIIKQVYIPAIQGNFAFRTEEDAQKTAEFILDKMNNNIFPPTLSKEELTYLNVLP